ncbi:MAG: hypothetical protein ABI451_03905, partial [Dokdonella sp.]
MLLALSLWAMASVAASQQTDVPAAEKQFRAWLTVFNAGDRVALQEFLLKNNPERAGHVDDDLRFRDMTGGFEFKKTEQSAPTKYVALLKERGSDTFVRATMEVEEVEP